MALRRPRARHDSRARAAAPRATVCSSALSGGSDSVALLLLLRELAGAGRAERWPARRTSITACATRADDDEQFCRALAARLACRSSRARGRARWRATRRTSLEDAGRRARYAVLRARRRRARRRRHRDRAHAGRSGRDVPAAADPRRGPARACGIQPARRASVMPAAARRRPRRAPRLPAQSAASAFREDASNADLGDSAEPGPARADAVAGARFLAGDRRMCSRARRRSRGRTRIVFTRSNRTGRFDRLNK